MESGPWHHHHHDYVETWFQTESGCLACREAELRKDDVWNRPYRWVYDYGPPCTCDEPATKRDATPERRYVLVADVLPTKAKDLPWTWEDEGRNLRTRQCLCCGRPGHYQEMLEAYMGGYATDGLGIVVDDEGYVSDGHHRVVAALRVGIEILPVESKDEAQARWVRDHGYVDWDHRKFGDR